MPLNTSLNVKDNLLSKRQASVKARSEMETSRETELRQLERTTNQIDQVDRPEGRELGIEEPGNEKMSKVDRFTQEISGLLRVLRAHTTSHSSINVQMEDSQSVFMKILAADVADFALVLHEILSYREDYTPPEGGHIVGTIARPSTASISNGRSVPEDFDEYLALSASQNTSHTPLLHFAAMRYCEGLHKFQVRDLPADSRTCAICMEPYFTGIGAQNEEPVRLRNCHHVFGEQCIRAWLNFGIDRPQITCPSCRDILFKNPRARRPAPNVMLADITTPFDGQEWDMNEFIEAIEQTATLADIQELLEPGEGQVHVPPELVGSHNTIFAATTDDPFIFARQVLKYYLLLTRGAGQGADLIARALVPQICRAHRRVQEVAEYFQFQPPWTQRGPMVESVLDPDTVSVIVLALQRLIVMEEAWFNIRRIQ